MIATLHVEVFQPSVRLLVPKITTVHGRVMAFGRSGMQPSIMRSPGLRACCQAVSTTPGHRSQLVVFGTMERQTPLDQAEASPYLM